MSLPLMTETIAYSGTPSAKRFATYAGAQAGANANTIGVFASVDATVANGGTGLATVVIIGKADVEFGGAVSPGGYIKTNADGQAVAHDSSNPKVAYLPLSASATVAGDVAEVVLLQNVA